jgi:hypothetical protein
LLTEFDGEPLSLARTSGGRSTAIHAAPTISRISLLIRLASFAYGWMDERLDGFLVVSMTAFQIVLQIDYRNDPNWDISTLDVTKRAVLLIGSDDIGTGS